MAKAAKSELEREELYHLLGRAENVALMQRGLALAISGDVPTLMAPGIVSAASARHPEEALDFAIRNWDKLSKMLEVNSAFQFLPRLAVNSTELATIDKLNAFAAAHVPENARQDYVLAAARVRYFAKVRATRLPEVDAWLASPANSSASRN